MFFVFFFSKRGDEVLGARAHDRPDLFSKAPRGNCATKRRERPNPTAWHRLIGSAAPAGASNRSRPPVLKRRTAARSTRSTPRRAAPHTAPSFAKKFLALRTPRESAGPEVLLLTLKKKTRTHTHTEKQNKNRRKSRRNDFTSHFYQRMKSNLCERPLEMCVITRTRRNLF